MDITWQQQEEKNQNKQTHTTQFNYILQVTVLVQSTQNTKKSCQLQYAQSQSYTIQEFRLSRIFLQRSVARTHLWMHSHCNYS